MRSLKRRGLAGVAAITTVAALAGLTDTASAGPVTQEGLVNVNLTGTTVQIPIALAANICDVNVAVLVGQLNDGSAPCEASADPTAEVATDDGGPVSQRGLVNVNVTNLVVQVPIGIAANVCDVNVGVLINDLRDSAATCQATGVADAITTITGWPCNGARPSPDDARWGSAIESHRRWLTHRELGND